MRRRFLRLVGAIGACGLAGCSGTDQTVTDTTTANGMQTGDVSPTETETATDSERDGGSNWPQFQFDAQNTGHSPDRSGPKANITKKWQYDIGTAIQTAPVIEDSTVFVNADQLYAISASDGSVEWTFGSSGGGTSPVVHNGTVCVGGAGQNVYGVDAESGEEQWRKSLGSNLNTPTLAPPRVFISSQNAGLAAFDLESGDQLWRKTINPKAAPAVYQGEVYTIRVLGLLVMDVGDGSKRWKGGRPGDRVHAPTVVGNRLFILDDSRVIIYSTSEQKVTKRINFDDTAWLGSPSATTGGIYASNESNNIYSINWGGEQQWSFDAGANNESAPALVDEVLYFGSNDRNVYAVDTTTGEELWSFETGRVVKSAPAVAGETVYVGSDDGKLYALHESD